MDWLCKGCRVNEHLHSLNKILRESIFPNEGEMENEFCKKVIRVIIHYH